MTRHQPAHKRLSEARRLAEAKGRPFEVWEGDGGNPQAYTCPQHPGVRLTLQQLRTAPPDPAAWLYLVRAGESEPLPATTGLDALADAYALALEGAPA